MDMDRWTQARKIRQKAEADHRTQRTPHVSKLHCSALACCPQLATACWSYAMLRLLTFFFPDFKIQNPPSSIAVSLFSTAAKAETETSRRSRGVSEPGRNPLKNPRVGDGFSPCLGASWRGKHPKHHPLFVSSILLHGSTFRWALGDFLLYLLARAPLPLLLVPVARCLSILNAGGHRGRGCVLWSS